MGTYVDIAGVNTWYDEVGSGEPLLLLPDGDAPAARRTECRLSRM